MKQLIIIFLLVGIHLVCYSQPIEGMTGLMKIPSAEMQTDGTFILGGNYLPATLLPEKYDFNTGNYYFNITFLPFVEFTYCSTLLRWEGNHNQDRSFGLRLRLLKESRFFPSIVTGGNDLYTSVPGDKSSSSSGNQLFNSIYGVATKHFLLNKNTFGITMGYGTGGIQSVNLKGVFGGITFVPEILPSMKLMAEYDAEVINTGVEISFYKHFYLMAMAYNLKYFAGGFAYRIYLKK